MTQEKLHFYDQLDQPGYQPTRANLRELTRPELKIGLSEIGVTAKDIIAKTRDRIKLSPAEIFAWVNDFTSGVIPDYQVASWLMAVRMRESSDYTRLSINETVNLTLAMAVSGEMLDLDRFGLVVDKHSSGGVGDKTTLVVAPLVAACGLKVGKMSGRGLAHTGGTLDKLESIPGFRVDLSKDEFLKILDEDGIVVTGQTGELAPADGKMYALRDATETVQSIPLIAASIMSKKIASGANVIVLDVTCGEGAFMKTHEDARHLAETMVNIGKSLGIKVIAEITDMNQPRGLAIGNALEVLEAIHTLKGEGFKDFTDYCVETAARLVHLAGYSDTMEQAEELVREKLKNHSALEKFRTMVKAQGGNPSVVDNPETILKLAGLHHVNAPRKGFIKKVNPLIFGETVMKLGGGRQKKSDAIDHSVGIALYPNTKVGSSIEEGEPLYDIYSDDPNKVEFAERTLREAIEIIDGHPLNIPNILGLVS